MNSFKRFEDVLKLVPEHLPDPAPDEDQHIRCMEEMKLISLIQPLYFYAHQGVRENIKKHIYKNSFSRCRNQIDEPAVVVLKYSKNADEQ